MEETPDGGLKLNVIQPSAIADGVRGRCRVAVEREGAKGPRYYESLWFDFKSRIEDETGKPEGPEVTPVEQGLLKHPTDFILILNGKDN